jgi:uracil-DNA glycosylase
MSDERTTAMERLREQGLACTRCDLHLSGTQVVWGEGDPHARVMLIGQGPGEQEAKAGRPFVGPSGEVLNAALAEVGIDRGKLWISNTIKHWASSRNERGRLVNRTPKSGEVQACRIWIDGELTIVQPSIVVCIGAPSAQAIIDKKFKITESRGRWFKGANGEDVIATFHPSYLIRLRAADPPAYDTAWAQVLADLRAVAERAQQLKIDLTPA